MIGREKSHARATERSSVSEMPADIFAKASADAGAIRKSSAQRRRSIWRMGSPNCRHVDHSFRRHESESIQAEGGERIEHGE